MRARLALLPVIFSLFAAIAARAQSNVPDSVQPGIASITEKAFWFPDSTNAATTTHGEYNREGKCTLLISTRKTKRQSDTCFYTYDKQGRLIQKKYSAGDIFTYRYDANGRCISSEHLVGGVMYNNLHYDYDAKGRLLRTYSLAGNSMLVKEQRQYDSLGRLTLFITEKHDTIVNTYSLEGRRTNWSGKHGESSVEEYDMHDSLIRKIAYNVMRKSTPTDSSYQPFLLDSLVIVRDAAGKPVSSVNKECFQAMPVQGELHAFYRTTYEQFENGRLLTRVTLQKGDTVQAEKRTYNPAGQMIRATRDEKAQKRYTEYLFFYNEQGIPVRTEIRSNGRFVSSKSWEYTHY